MRDRLGQRARGGDVDALLRAVALDVGVDDAGDAERLRGGAPGRSRSSSLVSSQPLHRDLAVARVDADRDAAGKAPAGLARPPPGCSSAAVPKMTRSAPSAEQRAGALDACARRRRPRSESAAPRTAPRSPRRSPARRSPRRRDRRRAGSAPRRRPSAAPWRPDRRRRRSRRCRSPRSRRTHLPPFRSMAGMISIGPSAVVGVAERRRHADACAPTDAVACRDQRAEVLQDLQADALALLRVELAGEEVVAGDRRDELAAVVGGGGDQRRVAPARRSTSARSRRRRRRRCRAGAAASCRLRIWFQPMCGMRKSGSSRSAEAHARARAGCRGPRTGPNSSLSSNSSCMPRQMPRNGVPRSITRRDDVDQPVGAQVVHAGAEGADAGQHDARRRARSPPRRASPRPHTPTRSKPFCTQRRLPMP